MDHRRHPVTTPVILERSRCPQGRKGRIVDDLCVLHTAILRHAQEDGPFGCEK